MTDLQPGREPAPVNTTTSTAEDRNLACSTDESRSEDGVMATQIGTGKPIAAQVVGGHSAATAEPQAAPMSAEDAIAEEYGFRLYPERQHDRTRWRINGKLVIHDVSIPEPVWDAVVDLRQKLEQAERERDGLKASLGNMIGWAKYAEGCDPFYFSEQQAPEWKNDLAVAEAALRGDSTQSL